MDATSSQSKKVVWVIVVVAAVAVVALIHGYVRAKHPKVTVEQSGNQVTVKKNGKDVGGVQLSGNAKVYKQTANYAYVTSIPEATEGYLLYPPGVYQVYQVSLTDTTKAPVDVSRGEAALQAVSSDDNLIAYADYGSKLAVIIKNLSTGKEIVHPVSGPYHQFGSMVFSPDNKKLAYAAAAGFPGKEQGAVFVINTATGEEKLVALTKERDTYFVVKGWKDNDKVDYEIGKNLNQSAN